MTRQFDPDLLCTACRAAFDSREAAVSRCYDLGLHVDWPTFDVLWWLPMPRSQDERDAVQAWRRAEHAYQEQIRHCYGRVCGSHDD